MENKKKNINEEISEIKNIPVGKEFSNLLSIYKVVQNNEALSYKNGYDRKLSAGWNGRGNDSYGEVVYSHLTLKDAIHMIGGSYGHAIVQFKLLGGLKDYVFFNADRDPVIKNLLIKEYGRPLNLYEQLLALTNNVNIAQRYGGCNDPSTFGRHYQKEIRRQGYYLRGMVCDYWGSNDVVIYPFKFSDVITCAVATGLTSYMTEQEVRQRFVGVLGQEERERQSNFIDIVPHLEVVNAKDPDGAQYIRVGDKIYANYESPMGYNILVIDDENIVKPNDKKLFPDTVRIDEMPSNLSRKGNFAFKMNGYKWEANVLGQADGQQYSSDGEPIFRLKGTNDWYEWKYLSYMFENPDYVKSLYQQQNNNETELNEAFKPGMTYDDFVNNNKAIGYVCIHQTSLNGILNHGFSREYAAENDANYNGGRGFYGNGVYGCVSLGRNATPDHFRGNLDMKEAGASRLSYYRDSSKSDGLKYGGVILKCSIIGGWNRFLILDKDLASKVYKGDYTIERQINDIVGSKDPDAAKELIYAMRCSEGFRYEVSDSDSRTTPPLARLFRGSLNDFQKWEMFFRKYGIRGAVYHGGNDGYGFVCYDYSEVVPIAISYDHGATFTTDGINWEKTQDRLTYGGDPINKLSAKYKSVSPFPKKINVGGEIVFGCVNVEKRNGKFNCVRMDTLKEIFPVDFDIEPTVSIRGTVKFQYKGYNFNGNVFNIEADGPTFFYDGNEYSFNDIDGVIYYYIEGNSQEQQNGEEGYVEQNDITSQQELQESFFRFLDKMELL